MIKKREGAQSRKNPRVVVIGAGVAGMGMEMKIAHSKRLSVRGFQINHDYLPKHYFTPDPGATG